MRDVLSDARGFTTAELVVASLFALLILGTLYGFYREQLYNLLSQETKTATLEDARGALDLMIRELKNAGSFPLPSSYPTTPPANESGCLRIVAASATSIRIQADLNGDGDCDGATSAETGEDVTYGLAAATSTCPGTIVSRKVGATGQCLVANVVIPAGTDFLTYYSAGSATPLSHPIGSLNAIKRVKVTFAVQLSNPNPYARSANPTVSTTLSSGVEFRN